MENHNNAQLVIPVNKDKFIAVQAFLEEKGLNLEQEVEGFFEALFNKYVPKNVKVYIEKAVSLSENSEKSIPKSGAFTKKSDNFLTKLNVKSPQRPPDSLTEKSVPEAPKTPQSIPPDIYTPPLPYDRFERNKGENDNE